MYEMLGFALVLGLAIIALAILSARLSPPLRRLLWLAFGLRVAGAVARYLVLFHAYGGSGDALAYFQEGLSLQDALFGLDFATIEYEYGRLWGTAFVTMASAIVLAAIGPTLLGEFLVFSLASLLGVWLMARAAAQDPDDLEFERYGLLLACSPSLCFWPCSVGKDAIIILGLGMIVRGYVGRHARPLWIILAAGLALVAAVRPHLAAMAGVSLVAAEVIPGDGRGWSVGRAVKLLFLSGCAIMLVIQMGESFAFDPTELASLEDFIDHAAHQTLDGTTIQMNSGLARFVLAPVNVLCRPFPWEAHNIGAVIASFELLGLWGYAWLHRRRLTHSLRTFHHHRATRFALPCGVLMAIAFGLTFFNLGILARQRVAPFSLLLAVFAFRREQIAPSQERAASRSRVTALGTIEDGT